MGNGNGIITRFKRHDGRLSAAALRLINHLLVALVSSDLENSVLVQIDPNRSPVVISTDFPSVGATHLSMKDSIKKAQVIVVSVNADTCVSVIPVIVEIQTSIAGTVGQSARTAWGEFEHIFDVRVVLVLDGFEKTMGIKLTLRIIAEVFGVRIHPKRDRVGTLV